MSASASELSEVFLGGVDIGFVSLQFCEKTTEIDQFTINTDGCIPTKFLGISPLESTPGSFPSLAVPGIFGWRGLAEIGNPIVVSDAIDMIQPTGWQSAVDPEPREMMNRVTDPEYHNQEVSIRMSFIIYGCFGFSSSSISRLRGPIEFPGVWIITDGFCEPFPSEDRYRLSHQRTKRTSGFGRKRVDVSGREFSSEGLSFCKINVTSLFFDGERSEVYSFIPMSDCRRPPTSIGRNTDQTGRIGRCMPNISGILPGIDFSEVRDPIVIRVSVNVIDDANRINAIHVEPCEPMSVVESGVYDDSSVTFFVDLPNRFPESYLPCLVTENAAFGIIIEKHLKATEGYHGGYDRTNSKSSQWAFATGVK